jgi:hypothetical protein
MRLAGDWGWRVAGNVLTKELTAKPREGKKQNGISSREVVMETVAANSMRDYLLMLLAVLVGFAGGRILKFLCEQAARKMPTGALGFRRTALAIAARAATFPLAVFGICAAARLIALPENMQALRADIVAVLLTVAVTFAVYQAVALAAQDTIKNFFGSLVIFADRPFRLGDRIVVDDQDGTIEEVGMRSTRIRTLDGHLVAIPNGELANKTIRNISRRPYIKRMANITITYDTPPEYWEFMAFDQAFNLEILRRFNAEGIAFAFPTQTLYLAGDPNRPLDFTHPARPAAPAPPNARNGGGARG